MKLTADLDSKIIKVRPPGSVNLGISLRHIERLPSPFTSKCTSEYPADYQLANFDYSEALCQAECKSLFINQTCGCWHPYRVPAQVNISAINMFKRTYWQYTCTGFKKKWLKGWNFTTNSDIDNLIKKISFRKDSISLQFRCFITPNKLNYCIITICKEVIHCQEIKNYLHE